MRNIPITGGRDVGPPKGWDPATQGDCLTLSVLQTMDNGQRTITTAWGFDGDELDALRTGGHFFTSLALPFVPLQRLWVQAANGEIVSDLASSVLGVTPATSARRESNAVQTAAAMRAAIITIGTMLEQRLTGQGQTSTWKEQDNATIVKRLADLVDQVQPAPDVKVPIFTLADIARQGRGKGPIVGEPVDPATQTDLERSLGVVLNPPGTGQPDDTEPTDG